MARVCPPDVEVRANVRVKQVPNSRHCDEALTASSVPRAATCAEKHTPSRRPSRKTSVTAGTILHVAHRLASDFNWHLCPAAPETARYGSYRSAWRKRRDGRPEQSKLAPSLPFRTDRARRHRTRGRKHPMRQISSGEPPEDTSGRRSRRENRRLVRLRSRPWSGKRRRTAWICARRPRAASQHLQWLGVVFRTPQNPPRWANLPCERHGHIE